MNAMQNQQHIHTQDESPLEPHPGPPGEPDYGPVRVQVEGPVRTTTGGDQFGSYSTIDLPASAATVPAVQQLLARDPLRQFAYLTPLDAPIVVGTELEPLQSVANVAAGGSTTSLTRQGQSATPTAGIAILQLTQIPPGTYTLGWIVQQTGPIAAVDINNIEVQLGATLLGIAMTSGNAGTNATQVPITFTVPPGAPGTLNIRAIVNATAGTTYIAQATLTPTGVVAGPPLPTGGVLVLAGQTSPPIRHNDPVFAANTSLATNRVGVWVERGRTP